MPADHPLTELQNQNQGTFGIAPYIPSSAFAISREALDFLQTKCFFDQEIPSCEISLRFLYEMRMTSSYWKRLECLLPFEKNIPMLIFGQSRKILTQLGMVTLVKRAVILGGILINTKVFSLKHKILKWIKFNWATERSWAFWIYYDEASLPLLQVIYSFGQFHGTNSFIQSYPIMRQLTKIYQKKAIAGFSRQIFRQNWNNTKWYFWRNSARRQRCLSWTIFIALEKVSLWPNVWIQGETCLIGFTRHNK